MMKLSSLNQNHFHLSPHFAKAKSRSRNVTSILLNTIKSRFQAESHQVLNAQIPLKLGPNSRVNPSFNSLRSNTGLNSSLISNSLKSKSFNIKSFSTLTTPATTIRNTLTDKSSDISITHNHHELSLTINSESNQIHDLTLSYVWLRDACQSDSSIHPQTRQKLFKSSDIPTYIYPIQTSISFNTKSSQSQLVIKWSHHLLNQSGESKSKPHISKFDLSFLKLRSDQSKWINHRHQQNYLKPILWSNNQNQLLRDDQGHRILQLQKQSNLFINFKSITEKNLLQYQSLNRLNRDGLVFFDQLSDQNNTTHPDLLTQLIDNFQLETRRTFYGDYWDVKSQGDQATNVANTSLTLDLHMDLVHFQNPPRFQFLYCVKNEVKGGRSTFVDGYAVAEALFNENPLYFHTLATLSIPFEYINAGHHTYYSHPTIELHPGISIENLMRNKPKSITDSLRALNYAPPFQGPLENSGPNGEIYTSKDERSLLNALKVFDEISNQDRFRFEILLKPGECVGFDNRRILHARTAFESKKNKSDNLVKSFGSDDVKRWLRGCYVDGDSVWDRIRVLSQEFGPPDHF
ncbi:taurine catabolism dioxygenase TauD, TfdA family-domain-containing protein [Melampsora americana]|nr:taurine catabolism dioxygenase TauD, TfdA family-domain-containing protein [Melampsora americana]